MSAYHERYCAGRNKHSVLPAAISTSSIVAAADKADKKRKDGSGG